MHSYTVMCLDRPPLKYRSDLPSGDVRHLISSRCKYSLLKPTQNLQASFVISSTQYFANMRTEHNFRIYHPTALLRLCCTTYHFTCNFLLSLIVSTPVAEAHGEVFRFTVLMLVRGLIGISWNLLRKWVFGFAGYEPVIDGILPSFISAAFMSYDSFCYYR